MTESNLRIYLFSVVLTGLLFCLIPFNPGIIIPGYFRKSLQDLLKSNQMTNTSLVAKRWNFRLVWNKLSNHYLPENQFILHLNF
jgi:hypothetical protein